MSGKSVRKNYIYSVGYQILVLVTPLITTPYVSRTLGADGIGTYSFTASIVTYFTLFATLGTSTYGQREISYVQEDKRKRTEVFWNIEILSCISTFLVLLLYGIYVLFFCDDTIIYSIFAMNVIAVAFDITWLFQGMEEFGKIVFRNVIFKILNVIYIFIFVRSDSDLEIYVLGMCLLPMLSVISLWSLLHKMVNKPDWKKIKPFANFGVVLSMFIPTIAISIYIVLDKTMIGLLTDVKAENGYYEQALKLSKTALTLVTALGTVMVPRVGHYYEKQELDVVKKYIYRSYQFVWFLGIPLCMGLIGISSNLVPWFYGSGYDKVVPLLSILSFLILAIGINNVTGIQYLMPTKRQNTFTFTVLIGAVVNVIFNLILIPHWYSIGAAIASVLAETVIAVLQIVIIRKELSPQVIISCSRHYWMSGLVMFGGLYGMGRCLKPSIIHSIMMIISGGVIYFALLLAMKDDFFIKQIKFILQKVGA